MSVCRSEIAHIQSPKDIGGLFGHFDVVGKPSNLVFACFVDDTPFGETLVGVPPPFIIALAGGKVHQVLGKSSFERINRHVVVIEDDKEVIAVHGGVVQSFKRQSSCHGSIANNGDYVIAL